ncbi:MAG TPA: phosphoribosylformylglycinamidine synthase subunit PurL [Opitutaceae bacterium]|jgi:phosphoribosylformylglycinamidine synthase|nr:phosphoribosylformylglycinamidine synthase subunit PurL [Opitutaceae bacterium]
MTLPPNPDPVLNQPVTAELIRKHGLLPDEYALIQRHLGRDPVLTELGIFSVMWSEHCSYKNTRPLLKGFPTEKRGPTEDFGRVLVKAGEENAGIIDVGGGWAIAFKIESHNHPSAVEPFEGAATGVGGIIRDIFTMGARPALLTNSLRFGDLGSPATRRLLRGVVAGIAHYGNCVGVPTVGGDVYFDRCYEGNPLVNALCLGTLRHDQIRRGKATGVGNPVYYVGAATGRDGLGGAAFASKELSAESAADRPAVQKGDPFMEKLLIEACLEMMAIPGLVVGIQDMGAAGLTCSTCETASRGGAGIEIELDRVPQRETGMNSYEIMLSESQERMLVIVQRGREAEIEAVFEKWDLHAARIGEVTATGRMVVKHHGVVVADIPAPALTDEAPVYRREAREPAYLARTRAWTPEAAGLPDLDQAGIRAALPRLLAHPTIASKRWLYRQFDHMVQHGTVVVPGSDAGVVRLRLGETERFIAISNDCNGRYCYLNPHRGALIAMVECLRNLACAGAKALAMTDNLNFGNPYKPENFYQLQECVRGLAEACRHFDVPVVGGNVSLYNESPEGAIDPTPTVSVVGLIAQEAHITRSFLRRPGEVVLLLGDAPRELGGSQFLGLIHGLKTGDAPEVDLAAEARLQQFLLDQIGAGRIRAAHDLSEGGLLVALAEMLFGPEGGQGVGGPAGPQLGAAVDLRELAAPRLDALLFGESQGRVLVAADPEAAGPLAAAAARAGVAAHRLGVATADALLSVAGLRGGPLVWPAAELRRGWEGSIEEAMKRPGIAES